MSSNHWTIKTLSHDWQEATRLQRAWFILVMVLDIAVGLSSVISVFRWERTRDTKLLILALILFAITWIFYFIPTPHGKEAKE